MAGMAWRDRVAAAHDWLLAPPTSTPVPSPTDPRMTWILRYSAGVFAPVCAALLTVSGGQLVSLRDITRELSIEVRNIATNNQAQSAEIKELQTLLRASDLKSVELAIRLRAIEARLGVR
jgi:hypothetical protein